MFSSARGSYLRRTEARRSGFKCVKEHWGSDPSKGVVGSVREMSVGSTFTAVNVTGRVVGSTSLLSTTAPDTPLPTSSEGEGGGSSITDVTGSVSDSIAGVGLKGGNTTIVPLKEEEGRGGVYRRVYRTGARYGGDAGGERGEGCGDAIAEGRRGEIRGSLLVELAVGVRVGSEVVSEASVREGSMVSLNSGGRMT